MGFEGVLQRIQSFLNLEHLDSFSFMQNRSKKSVIKPAETGKCIKDTSNEIYVLICPDELEQTHKSQLRFMSRARARTLSRDINPITLFLYVFLFGLSRSNTRSNFIPFAPFLQS